MGGNLGSFESFLFKASLEVRENTCNFLDRLENREFVFHPNVDIVLCRFVIGFPF